MCNKIILYPGCLILYRFPEYEKSARRILERLGYTIVSLPTDVCCGSYLEGITANWYKFGAYTLALAEHLQLPIVTLCGGCTNTFKRIKDLFDKNPSLKEDVNQQFKSLGLSFTNTVKVQHLIEILYHHQDELRTLVSNPLTLNCALVHPCQVYRPSEQTQFDHPTRPTSMKDIVTITGSTIITYKEEWSCCGSSLYLSGPELALTMAKQRINHIRSTKASVLITACGNCHLLLQRLQNKYSPSKFPVLFLSQLLGLAVRISPSELGISQSLEEELFS